VSPDQHHDAPWVSRPGADPPPVQPGQRGALSYEEFLYRVARRASLRPHEALPAILAVLEALADRINGREVDHLVVRVPVAFVPALERGKAQSNGAARPLSLQQFLEGVAEREGVTPEVARDHARAVLTTLREAVGEKEFADIVAQLPDEYAPVVAETKARADALEAGIKGVAAP
jgi:uncharacterized protein (DUF2267 family)